MWMFCSKCSNNSIMKTHYRCLSAIYDTQIETYQDLRHISDKTDIHTPNIQLSITEIYKCLNKLSPPFTYNYYIHKSNLYNLIGKHLLKLHMEQHSQ